jgi:phosphonate transport system ATP-binding protein
MSDVAIELRNVQKSFVKGHPVLKRVSLQINRGEMVALIGASGSGKSTLIRTVSGLLRTDADENGRSGTVQILGTVMQANGRVSRDAKQLRSRVGIVFQQFNLVPRLSVLKNVCFGFLGRVPGWRGTLGRFTRREKQQALLALRRVGIEEQALKRGSALSGGQQQRAAIARSLVQGSEILIADEPIASLDPSSARRVMDILADLNKSDGITVLVSLHQVEYALGYCPRTIALRDGEVVYDGPSDALTPAFLSELYGAESEELFLPGLEATKAGGHTRPRHEAHGTTRPAIRVIGTSSHRLTSEYPAGQAAPAGGN